MADVKLTLQQGCVKVTLSENDWIFRFFPWFNFLFFWWNSNSETWDEIGERLIPMITRWCLVAMVLVSLSLEVFQKLCVRNQVSAVKDLEGVEVSNTFFENHLGSSSDSGSCSSSKLLYLVIWLRTLYQISSFSRILWCSLYCFWQTMSLTSQSFHIVVVVSCLVNSIEWYDFCSLQHCCNFTCGNIFFEADHFTITKAHLISILACKRPY